MNTVSKFLRTAYIYRLTNSWFLNFTNHKFQLLTVILENIKVKLKQTIPPFRVVTSSVRSVFFYLANWNRNFRFVKVLTESDQNSWKTIDFGFWAWSLGQLGLWFFFQKFSVWAFFLKKKCNIQDSCLMTLLCSN